MKHLIVSESAAECIAEAARRDGKEAIVYSYQQRSSRLTLFGVEVVTTDANGIRRAENILHA